MGQEQLPLLLQAAETLQVRKNITPPPPPPLTAVGVVIPEKTRARRHGFEKIVRGGRAGRPSCLSGRKPKGITPHGLTINYCRYGAKALAVGRVSVPKVPGESII